MMHLALQSISVSLFVIFVRGQITTNCPLLGSIFPAPTTPATSSSILKAQSTFLHYLNTLLLTGTTPYGTLDTKTTSFSINIFSAHDNSSVFSYHYAAPDLNGSLTSGVLNDETMYRIGSLSKLLTVYTLLAEVGDGRLDDAVTKYVPELAATVGEINEMNELDTIKWKEITIRALGSHLSGIPRDCECSNIQKYKCLFNNETDSVEDVADLGVPVLSFGLPLLNSSELPTCGESLETPVCSRKGFSWYLFYFLLKGELTYHVPEFMAGINAAHSFKSTYNTPLYSNAAIQILAYALEGITNKSFAHSFNSSLAQPLNLSRTYLNNPPDSVNAIIPGNKATSLWGFDLGDETP